MIFTKISLVFLKPWIYDDDREIVTAQKPFQKGWAENMRKEVTYFTGTLYCSKYRGRRAEKTLAVVLYWKRPAGL